MSTADRRLAKDEIERAFNEQSQSSFPPILSTKEAAKLLGVSPKTLDVWKNAGYLEGTYRKRQGQVRYLRDRLVAHFFNGPEWNAKEE